MVNTRSSIQERAIIFEKPDKRPYGAQLQFQVLHSGVLGEMESVTILLDSGAVASLAPLRQTSWEGGRRFEARLEGFPTASAAEEQGRQLSQAVLWTAISLNFGLRLSYRTQEPTAVFERLRSRGALACGEAVTGWSPQVVLQQLVAGFATPVPDSQTLLSMEIFASSHLEASDRAAFLTAVSALEPLAETQPLGPAVNGLVDEWLSSLRTATSIGQQHRASLAGRLNELRRESIRQALRRAVMTMLPDHATASKRVDSAYHMRSQLIHDGRLADYDVDLAAETREISNILRLIYAQSLGLKRHAPAAP